MNRWIRLIITLFLIAFTLALHAQKKEAVIDTIYCNVSCIEKFVETSSKSGKSTKIYAVYNDKRNEISELIPVSKSVCEYIEMCKQNALTPHLGIRLKNNQIVSIIKYKQRFIKKQYDSSR